MPSASRCARTAAKCSAQAGHRRSTIRGAPALSSAIAGSLESSRRRGFRSSRSRSNAGSASACRAVVLDQLGDVGRAADRVADRVEGDLHVRDAGVAVEAQGELDDLGVDRRPRVADRLDVELPELAVAARLRPVVAEHRADQGQLHRLGPGLHPVLDIGPHDPGGRFGTERPRLRLVGPRREPEELLLDGVGRLAQAALEDRGLLEQRGLDLPVAVARSELGGEALEASPGRALVGQQVAGPARSAVGGHGRKSRGRAPA